MNYRVNIITLLAMALLCFVACKKEEDSGTGDENIDYNPGIADDYSGISGSDNSGLWGPYNLHDPAILKIEDEYFIFSTDVQYGGDARPGIMRRKSADLVKWFFRGWVFDAIPPVALQHIQNNGGNATNIWAPFAILVNDEIRLYYSVSTFGTSISAIGMATAESPFGPWTDHDIVLSTTSSSPVNAIDPAVIIDQNTGQHWMTYGSYWSGIYIVELDPATGLVANPGDTGKKIAYRTRDGQAIEGPEILYNPEEEMYYLFVSYGWLEDSYSVRVGRSNSPDGPYFDYFGNDMAAPGDNFPILTAQYKFNNHAGWQGFGHCSLLHDGVDYYYVSQARPGFNIYLMNMHLHRLNWTSDGWPVLSPERYADVPQTTLTAGDIEGSWEHIYFTETETKNSSSELVFQSNGSISGSEEASWELNGNILSLTLENNSIHVETILTHEWDWENSRRTICYSGISNEGRTAWGKKITEENQ